MDRTYTSLHEGSIGKRKLRVPKDFAPGERTDYTECLDSTDPRIRFIYTRPVEGSRTITTFHDDSLCILEILRMTQGEWKEEPARNGVRKFTLCPVLDYIVAFDGTVHDFFAYLRPNELDFNGLSKDKIQYVNMAAHYTFPLSKRIRHDPEIFVQDLGQQDVLYLLSAGYATSLIEGTQEELKALPRPHEETFSLDTLRKILVRRGHLQKFNTKERRAPIGSALSRKNPTHDGIFSMTECGPIDAIFFGDTHILRDRIDAA